MRIMQAFVSCLVSFLIIDGKSLCLHLIFSVLILASKRKTPWIYPEDIQCFLNVSR